MQRLLFLALLGIMLAAPGPALAECANEIGEFRNTIDRDLESGKLDKGRHDQIAEELDRVGNVCRTDWQYRALKVLNSTKERYGYR
jgi:hypothetical protein